MIYEIGKSYLEIENNLNHLNSNIYNRLLHFKNVNKYTKNKIHFSQNNTIISINYQVININGSIKKTDIYPILANSASRLINDKNNIYIHSTIISKYNKGILILGDFGSGKTTLSFDSLKKGFNINSADQSWITIKNEKLYMKSGSKYIFYNNKVNYLNDTQENVELIKIIILNGSCRNGLFNEEPIINKDHIIKNLFRYCNWHCSIPLFTEFKYLYNLDRKIFNFLVRISELNIPVTKIRGDSLRVLDKLNLFISEDKKTC